MTNVTTEWLDGATVMLTAYYDTTKFNVDLFDMAGLTCPARVGKAVAKRQSEFLAGRLLAQEGQQQLGFAPKDVAIAESRAPVWPKGLTGSLTHAKGRCAAILSTDLSQSFGIDCEAIATGTSLDAIQKQTLTATDRMTIKSPKEATCVFSAKEALFKALYPQVGRFFGFDAAELSEPIAQDAITLKLTETLSDHAPKGRIISLNHRIWDTHVLAWVSVPAP